MQHKVVMITGGARRVGAVLSRRLHGQGLNVVIHYHASGEAAEALKRELEAVRPGSVGLVQADLLDAAGLNGLAERAVACFGRLDGLVNNASTFTASPVGEITEALWADLMGTNLQAPLFLSQALAPELSRREGFIINITDIHAERPLRHYVVYTVAKAGLAALTRSLALELGPRIRVNAVAPGPVMWPTDGSHFDDRERARIIAQTPLNRDGSPEDVAGAVCYLALHAPFVSGHTIAVDGGRSLFL